MTQLIIQPGPVDGKDAYVRSSEPNTNFGNSVFLQCQWFIPTSIREIFLLQFSLAGLPVDAVIDSAFLHLYNTHIGTPRDIQVRPADDAWVELTVTWNNKPSLGALITTFLPVLNEWSIIDITDTVKDWFSGALSNYGLYLYADEDGQFYAFFASSDYIIDPTLRPKLIINYSVLIPVLSVPGGTKITRTPKHIMSGFNAYLKARANYYSAGFAGAFPNAPPIGQTPPSPPQTISASYETTTGVLTIFWVVPAVMKVNARVRIWIRRTGSLVQRHVVATEDATILLKTITECRGGHGAMMPISTPGSYQIQLDTVDDNGLASAGSNVITVNI